MKTNLHFHMAKNKLNFRQHLVFLKYVWLSYIKEERRCHIDRAIKSSLFREFPEKFGLQNGSLGKMIVSYDINETNPEFQIPLPGSHFIKNSAVG